MEGRYRSQILTISEASFSALVASVAVLDVARSSLRYQAKPTDDTELRLAMIRLAKQYGWYGYRKVTALLRVNFAVPELRVTLNHYHWLIRTRNINTSTMLAGD